MWGFRKPLKFSSIFICLNTCFVWFKKKFSLRVRQTSLVTQGEIEIYWGLKYVSFLQTCSMSSCCFSTKPEPGLQKPIQGIWNFSTFSLSDSQFILILDICYLTESNTTLLPHVLRIILSNMVKLLEINFWKWAKWMCIFHAVLIQRDLFFLNHMCQKCLPWI